MATRNTTVDWPDARIHGPTTWCKRPPRVTMMAERATVSAEGDTMAIEELGQAGSLLLAQDVGRRFPGVLIQGDTLLTLHEDLAQEAPDSYALERVREWLADYERALDELGLALPYPMAGRVTPPQMLMSVADLSLRAYLRERTGRLAGMVVVGRHLDAMDQAVPLACDLIVAGIEPQSVVAVAQLPPGSTWRDGRDAVVTMLAALGYPVEDPLTPEDQWEVLLRAFAYWELPPEHFLGPFLHRVPAADTQSEFERELLLLSADLDHETEPARRAAVVERMRRLVRVYSPGR